MSQKKQEEGEERKKEVKLDSKSPLYKRYEQFLVGEVEELSEEDRVELGNVTHIFDNFANPNHYASFKDLSKVSNILDLRALKNVREIQVNFCFMNQAKQILWDFPKLEKVGSNCLYEASNLESVDFSTWHSIKEISGCYFLRDHKESVKLLNAHKLKDVEFLEEDDSCCQWLTGEVKRQVQVRENRQRDLLSVHLIAFKGSSKVSKMMNDIYVPRIVVLKFLIGQS